MVEARLRKTIPDPTRRTRARRYAMSYDRWLLGKRKWKPAPAHYKLNGDEASRTLARLGLL